MCNHRCYYCKLRCQYVYPSKYYDYSDTIYMDDFFKEQYDEWKKGQQQTVNVTKEEKEEWRFQWGDVVPKQGYQNYNQYIKDAACLITKKDHDLYNNGQIEDDNGEYRYYFGIKQLIS